jgi:hypothetical protein
MIRDAPDAATPRSAACRSRILRIRVANSFLFKKVQAIPLSVVEADKPRFAGWHRNCGVTFSIFARMVSRTGQAPAAGKASPTDRTPHRKVQG